MKNYKWSAALGVLILICGIWVLWNPIQSKDTQGSVSKAENINRMLPGEQFVKQHMTNSNGTIRTNLQQQSLNNNDVAQGEESLSESLGLWMLYAVEKGDRQLLDQSVNVLKEHFWHNGWIAWKVGQHTPPVSTNALVDDLRIAEALYRAGEKWGDSSYSKLADEIGNNLINTQLKNDVFTDFYDNQAKWAHNVLTLSYLNGTVIEKYHQNQMLSPGLYEKNMALLKNLPVKNGLFPFSYQVDTMEYTYHNEVNLIDQLYIVYHRAMIGVPSPDIWNFLKSEFASNGLLYGRYDSDTKKPAVTFESPAVYGLAILSAIELKEGDFAKDLYYRMIREQSLSPESELFGGYVDFNAMDTHIFDNLVPLLAERELYNAGFLQ